MLKYKRNTYSPKQPFNAEIAAARRASAAKALKALDEMNKIAKLNGTSEMTLEEINAEIAAARRDMDARRT